MGLVTGAFFPVSRVLSYTLHPHPRLSLSLSLSPGTGRREPWERGFCSPRLAHGAKMPRSPRSAHNAPFMQANSTCNTLRGWLYGRSLRKESLR